MTSVAEHAVRARSRAWAIALMISGTASAVDIEPRASIAGIYSDNVQHSNEAPAKDEVLEALIGARVREDTRRFHLDADLADLHEHFVHGKLPSADLPVGYLDLVATVVPDRFAWVVHDNIGQISNQLLDTLAPPDRETINTFSTGPEFFTGLGERNHLDLHGRYGIATYSRSRLDSRRYEGGLSLLHDVAGNVATSLNGEYRTISYNSDQSHDTIPTAFLGYSLDGSRTYFAGQAGYEWLEANARARGAHTPHVLLSMQRRVSPSVLFTMEYAHSFSDAVRSFRASSQSNFTGGSPQNVQATAAVFKSDLAYMMFVRSASRTRVSWEVTWNRESYVGAMSLDRRVIGSDGALEYMLSSRLALEARGRWAKERTVQLELPVTQYEVLLGLNRQLNSQLRVAVWIMSGKGLGGPSSFVEHRALLAISYAPGATLDPVFDPAVRLRLYERPLGEQMRRNAMGQTAR